MPNFTNKVPPSVVDWGKWGKRPSCGARATPGLHWKPSDAPNTIENNTYGFPEVLFKTMGKPQKALPIGPTVTWGSVVLSKYGEVALWTFAPGAAMGMTVTVYHPSQLLLDLPSKA